MSNDKSTDNQENKKDSDTIGATPAVTDLDLDNITVESKKNESPEEKGKKKSSKDKGKNKDKKPDKTIEKLKSKPTEEIQKEIKEDFKSHIFRYKTLSIIVSAVLFLFLFGLSVAVSYYKNLAPPADTNYIPKAEIELPAEMPENENTEIPESTESGSVQGVSTSSENCIENNQEILAEVLQCAEITQKSCLEHVDQFEYCMSSCLNILDEEECRDICRPVCKPEISNE